MKKSAHYETVIEQLFRSPGFEELKAAGILIRSTKGSEPPLVSAIAPSAEAASQAIAARLGDVPFELEWMGASEHEPRAQHWERAELIDPQTLRVHWIMGPGDRGGSVEVTESDDAVTIALTIEGYIGAQALVGELHELEIKLERPLGERFIRDAETAPPYDLRRFGCPSDPHSRPLSSPFPRVDNAQALPARGMVLNGA